MIEIVIAVGIAASIIVVVAGFSSNITTLQNLVSQKLQSRSDIDQTLQMIASEIRSASPSALGSYPLIAASTSSLLFYGDINHNGLAEEVHYFFATSSIEKGVIEPSGMPAAYPTSSEIVTDVADGIIIASSTPLFRYYDTAYTGVEPPLGYPIDISRIRFVQLSFSANVNTKGMPVSAEYFSTAADIRNLKSN